MFKVKRTITASFIAFIVLCSADDTRFCSSRRVLGKSIFELELKSPPVAAAATLGEAGAAPAGTDLSFTVTMTPEETT